MKKAIVGAFVVRALSCAAETVSYSIPVLTVNTDRSAAVTSAAADAGTKSALKTPAAEAKVKEGAAAKEVAEKSGAEAWFRYAEMLRVGHGVKKSTKEAARWTLKAAEAGHAEAQCQLGLFYLNGLGVDRDEDSGQTWLKKSAEQGCVQAQYNLGLYYAHVRDDKAALKWLNEAAKENYADAEYNLALLYLTPWPMPAFRGEGNSRRAISLLSRAAAQGHAAAKKALDEMGLDVPNPTGKSGQDGSAASR